MPAIHWYIPPSSLPTSLGGREEEREEEEEEREEEKEEEKEKEKEKESYYLTMRLEVPGVTLWLGITSSPSRSQ